MERTKMLVKKSFLISTLLSLSIFTNTTTASDGFNCKEGHCQVDVTRFAPSKKIHKFNIRKKEKIAPLDMDLKVVMDKRFNIEIIHLGHNKYIQQENEILEPINPEIERNTIIPSPEKFLKLIKATLPMPLYYCLDNGEPLYDEKEHQFNCVISG